MVLLGTKPSDAPEIGRTPINAGISRQFSDLRLYEADGAVLTLLGRVARTAG